MYCFTCVRVCTCFSCLKRTGTGSSASQEDLKLYKCEDFFSVNIHYVGLHAFINECPDTCIGVTALIQWPCWDKTGMNHTLTSKCADVKDWSVEFYCSRREQSGGLCHLLGGFQTLCWVSSGTCGSSLLQADGPGAGRANSTTGQLKVTWNSNSKHLLGWFSCRPSNLQSPL